LIRFRHAACALAALLSFSAVPAQAGNIDLLGVGQATFSTFAEEIGVATAYNPVSPAEPLGLLGFDVGVSTSFVDVDKSVWSVAGINEDTLIVPRIQARKGLPFGFDVGVSYISAPGSDVKMIGGELRKAILDGTAATPAVSVLAHYSTLSGVSALDLSSYGADIGISKGILMFTPYAGAGILKYDASDTSGTLADEDGTASRYYVGLKISPMPLLNLVVQADFGTLTSYTARINLGL